MHVAVWSEEIDANRVMRYHHIVRLHLKPPIFPNVAKAPRWWIYTSTDIFTIRQPMGFLSSKKRSPPSPSEERSRLFKLPLSRRNSSKDTRPETTGERRASSAKPSSCKDTATKPTLTIDTEVTGHSSRSLTPASSPASSPDLIAFNANRRGSAPPHASHQAIRHLSTGLLTPPNSPTVTPGSTSPASSSSSPVGRRHHSLTSFSFFKTDRQRKLEEIRLGKMPAPPCDTPRASFDSDISTLVEICDPSSSTTYNRENIAKILQLQSHKNDEISRRRHMVEGMAMFPTMSICL
jgi:hypothetical protein